MRSNMQRDHRSVRGTIAYLSHKPDRYLQERGREYFHIGVHSDGKRTIITHCEIDDRPSVMRDITYSVDEQWLPMDYFVRITVGDRFMGSGWFRFQPGHTECETFTALEGRVSQRMEHRSPPSAHVPEPRDRLRRLAPAPLRPLAGTWRTEHRRVPAVIAGQSWCDRPDGVPRGCERRVRGRRAHHGKGGDLRRAAFPVRVGARPPPGTPPYDVWCTADGEFLFLKGNVAGYMQTGYELVQLSR